MRCAIAVPLAAAATALMTVSGLAQPASLAPQTMARVGTDDER